MIRRTIAAATGALFAFQLLMALPAVVLAAQPNCTNNPEEPILSIGNQRVASGQTGAYALTEVFNPALCVHGPASDSGTRVTVGLYGGIQEYFEVGYVECWNTPLCAPYNGGAPYYYYAYSRAGGACGSDFTTIAKAPKGNVGSTPVFHDFEVSRWTDGYYYAFIDEVSQYGRTWASITCWSNGAGVQRVKWYGQAIDPGDQVGGTQANHAQLKDIQYKTSTGWHTVTRALGSACDFTDGVSAHRCGWGSTVGTFFNLWDTRS